MIKLNFLILFNLCLAFSNLLSQSPTIQWTRSFGGSESERGNGIAATSDGGFVVVGISSSSDGDVDTTLGSSDLYVVKVNAFNEIVFSKSYGGSDIDQANCVVESNDGGIIIGGRSYSVDGTFPSNYGGLDAIIMKTDSLGNVLWSKNYGGSSSDQILSVIKNDDSSYLFTGYSSSNDFDITDYFGPLYNQNVIVGKIDTLGNLLWLKSYGSIGDDRGHQIIKTKDSCYLICGYRYFGFADYYLIKIGNEGELIWEKTFGGSEFDGANSIYELSSGNIIVCGETTSNDGDVGFLNGYSDNWVIFLDSVGNLIWERSYGGSGAEDGYEIFETYDNAIHIMGTTTSFDGDIEGYHGGIGGDYWIFKIDTLGNIIWSDCYGGTSADYSYGSAQLIDSSYVITGMSWSIDGDVTDHHEAPIENTDMWTIRIKENCNYIKYYADADGDNFGNISEFIYSCFDTLGYVLNNLDCNDTVASINPLAKDICNDIDDNCNGEIDENSLFVLWYEDSDEDTFGNASIDSLSCHTLEGFVLDSTDCNDANPLIFPGTPEVLNGIDDDCDQTADEGLSIIENELVDLTINPNPTISDITMQFNILSSPTLTIYQMTGEIVYFVDNVISPYTFNTISFAPGVYFINLQDENDAAQGVFIKN